MIRKKKEKTGRVKIIPRGIIVPKSQPDFFAQTILMAAFAAIFFMPSCQPVIKTDDRSSAKTMVNHDSLMMERVKYFNSEVYPLVNKMVSSGDLITRMGTDITSYLLSKVNKTDTSFSHCGIVSIENDSAFVYHCIGGEFNPDQKMKREWLYEFTRPEHSLSIGIFSPQFTLKQITDLMEQVQFNYISGLPFDMQFDLRTNDKQYCSEMVAKSIGHVLGGLDWLEISKQDSLLFITIDNLYLNDVMKEKGRFNY